MNQGNPATHPRGRDRRSHAGVAATDHDQIVRAADNRLVSQTELLASPIRHHFAQRRRLELQVTGQIDAVATTIEASQVMQRQFPRTCFKFHRPAVMPAPLFSVRAKRFGQRLAVEGQLKLPWRRLGIPTSHPIDRSHPHAVLGRLGNLNNRSSIVDRPSQSMSQQIGRTHLLDELRVEFPATAIGEAFGFDKHLGAVCRRHHDDQDS